jgi:hypothetical protein
MVEDVKVKDLTPDKIMEYEENGEKYKIAYSQKLQMEDIKLKKIVIAIGLLLAFLLLSGVIFLILLMRSGKVTEILKFLVCG